MWYNFIITFNLFYKRLYLIVGSYFVHFVTITRHCTIKIILVLNLVRSWKLFTSKVKDLTKLITITNPYMKLFHADLFPFFLTSDISSKIYILLYKLLYVPYKNKIVFPRGTLYEILVVNLCLQTWFWQFSVNLTKNLWTCHASIKFTLPRERKWILGVSLTRSNFTFRFHDPATCQ